jgi:hypothetical protein
MTAGTGISIRGGDAIEIAGEYQRGAHIGQGLARAIGQGPSAPFLIGPIGYKEVFAMIDERLQGNAEFLTIWQMISQPHLPPDLDPLRVRRTLCLIAYQPRTYHHQRKQ